MAASKKRAEPLPPGLYIKGPDSYESRKMIKGELHTARWTGPEEAVIAQHNAWLKARIEGAPKERRGRGSGWLEPLADGWNLRYGTERHKVGLMTHEEALGKLAQWVASKRGEGGGGESLGALVDSTLADGLGVWKRGTRKPLAPSEIKARRARGRHLPEAIRALKISREALNNHGINYVSPRTSVTVNMLTFITDALIEERESGGEYRTADDVKKLCQILNVALSYAESLGRWGSERLVAPAASLCRGAKRMERTPKTVDRSLFELAVECAGPEWVKLALRLAYATGLRRGELFALRWQDVIRRDESGGSVVLYKIAGTISDNVHRPDTTKTGAQRWNAIVDPTLIDELQSWREWQEAEAAVLGCPANPYVLGEPGRTTHRTPRNATQYLDRDLRRRMEKQLGRSLEEDEVIRLKDTRTTIATDADELGRVDEGAEYVGHTPETSRAHYIKPSEQALIRRAIEHASAIDAHRKSA